MMMTTVEEVNSNKTKVPVELFFVVFCLIVLLPNSMSKLIHSRCKLTCNLLIKIIRLLTSMQTNNWVPVFML